MTEIISLKEAKEQGLTKYFTGKPCPKGHIAERYVALRKCIVCAGMSSRRNAHKYRDPEKAKEYYESHKAEHKANGDAWVKANPEKVKEIHKRWRDKAKEK